MRAALNAGFRGMFSSQGLGKACAGPAPAHARFYSGRPAVAWQGLSTPGGPAGPGGRGPSGPGRVGGSGNGNSDSNGGGWISKRGLLGWAASAAAVVGQAGLLAGGAQAREKQPATKELTVEQLTDAAWAVAGPVLTNLGFSGCMGYAAGLALKKVGQLFAVLIGLAFIAIQSLAQAGFITVNWTHVHKTVNQILDLNRDGKVDEKDFKLAFGSGVGMLSQGMPSVGGFLAGFALGLR